MVKRVITSLDNLPGRTTRHLLLKASVPPAFAWVRSAIRLLIAGAFYTIGYRNIATIISILAVISLVASVEVQIARAIVNAYPRLRAYVRKHRRL